MGDWPCIVEYAILLCIGVGFGCCFKPLPDKAEKASRVGPSFEDSATNLAEIRSLEIHRFRIVGCPLTRTSVAV